jgi:predicted RNase H-like HicB family nuclease
MHGYIVLVMTVPGGGYKAIFPDLPGCRAAGRSVEDALARARSALRTHAARLHRRGLTLPPPRPSQDVVEESTRHGAVGGACLELRPVSIQARLDISRRLPNRFAE